MRLSSTSLLRFLSSTSLLLAGCPGDDGATCGPEGAPAMPITATAGADVLMFGNLSSLKGNDCPDPAAPSGVVSLSIEGTEVGGAGRVTFCIPRPDLLDEGRALGSTQTSGQARVIDFSGTANGCMFAYDSSMPPSGTAKGTGVCKNGAAKEGFALEITGTVHVKRTCGATMDNVALMVTGKVAVTSRDME